MTKRYFAKYLLRLIINTTNVDKINVIPKHNNVFIKWLRFMYNAIFSIHTNIAMWTTYIPKLILLMKTDIFAMNLGILDSFILFNNKKTLAAVIINSGKSYHT